MLSAEERDEITGLLGHYTDPRAAVVEALKIVQEQRRWVPDEALPEIGALLGLSAHDVDAVATFYNLIFRRPVGRHVILVCDSVSCWMLGYEAIAAALQRKLGIGFGETTPDDRFTLLPICCLGACDKAPAMLIDFELHTDLTPERLDSALAAYE